MVRGLLAVGAFFFVSLPLSPSEERLDRPGSLLLVGGGRISGEVKRRFLDLAGGPGARIVVIPSASARLEAAQRARRLWAEQGAQVTVLHTTSRADADSPAFSQPLCRATAVWISGGDQSRFMARYGGTAVERELVALYRRGGLIGGTSAGASLVSRIMVAAEGEGRGLGFLDGVVVDQHFDTRHRLPRLLHVLGHHPEQLGLGLDEETAVIIHAKMLTVAGERTVRVCRVGSEPQVFHAGEQIAFSR